MRMRLLPLGWMLIAAAGCCVQATPDDAEALARDGVRLHAELQRCEVVHEANRRRFLAGLGGADEYRTLADLPPIPPSFDGPEPP